MYHRPTTRRTAVTGAAALVLGALAARPATATAATRTGTARRAGSLVLVGGSLADDNERIYGEIIRRAGGARARIGVITAASVPKSQDPDAGDPDRASNSEFNGAYYADLFLRHGAAAAEWIPVDLDHIANADDDRTVAQAASMTGFFFGGGDQFRYVTCLLGGAAHRDSRVLATIRAKLAAGAVVSGSSAGAQIASGPDMVTGGESWEGLRDGSAAGYFDDATRLGYWRRGGFGFLASGLLDTHTGSYGREGRILRLASDTGHDRVYGLEEDTALIVDSPGTSRERVRVLGTNGLTLADLATARARQTSDGWTLTGARYSFLTDGDAYDPRTRRVSPGRGKRPLGPRGTGPVPANPDIFYSVRNPDGRPYSFLGTARALAQSRVQHRATGTTFERNPGFDVTLTKGRDFAAWTDDNRTARTLLGLRVDIVPRRTPGAS